MKKVVRKDIDRIRIKHNWKVLVIIFILLIALYFVLIKLRALL